MLTLLPTLAVLVACQPTPTYKTITCSGWLKLANASDALSNGALGIASSYMNASGVIPDHGASDAADFADTISAVCGPLRLGNTKILALQPRIVSAFLSLHPEDAR